MSKRFFVSLTLSVFCALGLAACGGSDTTTTNSSNTTEANKTATTTTTPATTTTTPATTPATTTSTPATTTASGSGDKIGVAECDDYLAKYEACLTTKVPEAARAQFNSALAQTRSSWRQIASTPQGKSGLAMACKAAADQTKTAMKPYGCEF